MANLQMNDADIVSATTGKKEVAPVPQSTDRPYQSGQPAVGLIPGSLPGSTSALGGVRIKQASLIGARPGMQIALGDPIKSTPPTVPPTTPSALNGTAYTYSPPESPAPVTTSANPGELDWLRNNGVQANRPAVTWGLRGTAEIDRRGGVDSASGWMENPANREKFGSPVASPSFLAPPAKTGHFLADTINTAMYSHQLASQNRVAMQLAAMRQAQLKNSQTADYQNRVAANSEAETAIKRQELETKAPEIAASAEERRARAAKETAWESTAGERNKNAALKEENDLHFQYYKVNRDLGMDSSEATKAADEIIAGRYGRTPPKPKTDFVYNKDGQLITNTQ